MAVTGQAGPAMACYGLARPARQTLFWFGLYLGTRCYPGDRSALHCTVLHCTALHCTALHCTALHKTGLHYITLRGTAQVSALHHVCQTPLSVVRPVVHCAVPCSAVRRTVRALHCSAHGPVRRSSPYSGDYGHTRGPIWPPCPPRAPQPAPRPPGQSFARPPAPPFIHAGLAIGLEAGGGWRGARRYGRPRTLAP